MCKIDSTLINEVWDKAQIVPDYNPDLFRKDACGAWIRKDKFGDSNSALGWEIDHIYPASKLKERDIPKSVIDNILNLRPLNCINNNSKSDKYPTYTSETTSLGNKNIFQIDSFEIDKETQEKLKSLFAEYL